MIESGGDRWTWVGGGWIRQVWKMDEASGTHYPGCFLGVYAADTD